ncbi:MULTISPECIES: HAD family hydrolase [unclassified Streptomyces]|uniref:HAD family hydrolase n=1 Tax=unclassified Streptomyces TaxID=2593676 RepID=UPI00380E00CF
MPTSGDRAFVEARFTAEGLPLPAVQVNGSDVEHAKPAPDCFALAASRLGIATSECLVVEDAPAGIRAAVAAGSTALGLKRPTRKNRSGKHTCALRPWPKCEACCPGRTTTTVRCGLRKAGRPWEFLPATGLEWLRVGR